MGKSILTGVEESHRPPPAAALPQRSRVFHLCPAGRRVNYCYFNQDDCIRKKLMDNFSIHGIRPANSMGVSLRECADPKPYEESFVKPIEHDLKTYWPSFSCKFSDEKFWEHEWNEHGICSTRSIPSLYGGDYFRGTLRMKHATDIYGILRDIGVVLNDGNSKYNGAKIRRAITAVVAKRIYL